MTRSPWAAPVPHHARSTTRLRAAAGAALAAVGLLLGATGNATAAGPASAHAMRPPAPPAFATCESLDTLTLGKTVVVGPPPNNSFQPPLMDLAAHPFTWSNGIVTSGGFARTTNQGKAAGANVELTVNNIVLSINTGQNLSALRLAFGEYGGNLNLWINNTFVNVNNLAPLHNTTVAGVTIRVVGGNGNDAGFIEFVGPLNGQSASLNNGQLAIGGQELFLDDICFDAQ